MGCRGAEPSSRDVETERLAVRTAATARAVAGVDADRRPPPAASQPPIERAAPPARPTPIPTPVPVTPSPTPAIAFPRSRPITYVAIGASDTVGVGAPNPSVDGWVPQLHRRLPPGSKLVNLGISGARLGDVLQKELPKALEARPDLVTVWAVVNDLNANVDLVGYERDLDRLLGELVGKTPARVAIGNCPDLGRVPAYLTAGIPPDALRQEVARWNVVIARAVAKHPGRVYLVDLYARSTEVEVDPSLVAGDDFHPSASGYTRIAEVFWDFLVANRLLAA